MQELYGSVRGIVKQLRPEVIDTLGLKGALEGMVRSYDEADPHCEFSFAASRDFPDLRGQKAMAAYRAVQEALSNVVKHAAATRVCVSLDRDPDDGRARIQIKDNGRGFDVSARGDGGLGLIGMRERVTAVAGEMEVEARAGAGTTIKLWLSEV
jgi:two-component system sensor histidine kinase UhpB